MKDSRQKKILDIISEKIVLTQDEIQKELNILGFNVTQSTVSRDIKELRIIKGHDENGVYRYISIAPFANSDGGGKYNDLLKGSIIRVDSAMNDIVIKCRTGMASSAAVAIDSLFSEDMLGSVAGDDTIFIITKSIEKADELAAEIKNII